MIWLLASAAWAADCASPVPIQSLSELLDAAEQGYAALDVGAFSDRLDQAALALPCVDAVVPPSVAARYHALAGLRLYTSGNGEQAAAAFASARAADPAFRFGSELVPAGHEVLALFDGAMPGGTEPVPEPADVTLYFDGTEAAERPTARPVIVQLVSGAGAVEATAWAGAGDALPPYRVAEPVPNVSVTPVPEPLPEPLPPPRERRPRWALLGVAGAAAVTSAVLYGAGAASEARFEGQLPPEVGREELLALRSRTNALVIGSGVAGGVAAVGTVAFVVVR